MRWQLLPGALCETTVLPDWVTELDQRSWSAEAVLVFDRGMSCVDNLSRLVGNGQYGGASGGRPFLTSVKADLIPTCVALDTALLDELQLLPDDSPSTKVAEACEALGLLHLSRETYARDLGTTQPPMSRGRGRSRLPAMRMYLYFNREIQQGKRAGRQERIEKVRDFVAALNEELRSAKRPRKAEPTLRKVTRVLEKLQLLEVVSVTLQPLQVAGRTKSIASFQVQLDIRQDMLRNASRYDGVSLLVGHPLLQMDAAEAIAAYRQKNVVEADFCTIKSVLQLRPTFHWTDAKIQSHVTLCILALLVERAIETTLAASSLPAASAPRSANALLHEIDSVFLNRVRVDDNDLSTRTYASQRTRRLLRCLHAHHLLDTYPESRTVSVPVSTP